jgi:hypothetical protein
MVVASCEKYSNRGMDSHRHMGSGLIGQRPSQKIAKFDKPLELHVKGFNWLMTFPKKFQNFIKT